MYQIRSMPGNHYEWRNQKSFGFSIRLRRDRDEEGVTTYRQMTKCRLYRAGLRFVALLGNDGIWACLMVSETKDVPLKAVERQLEISP